MKAIPDDMQMFSGHKYRFLIADGVTNPNNVRPLKRTHTRENVCHEIEVSHIHCVKVN